VDSRDTAVPQAIPGLQGIPVFPGHEASPVIFQLPALAAASRDRVSVDQTSQDQDSHDQQCRGALDSVFPTEGLGNTVLLTGPDLAIGIAVGITIEIDGAGDTAAGTPMVIRDGRGIGIPIHT
jgi:hypothetical protein